MQEVNLDTTVGMYKVNSGSALPQFIDIPPMPMILLAEKITEVAIATGPMPKLPLRFYWCSNVPGDINVGENTGLIL